MKEYRNKQQAKQRPGPGQSPLLMQQQNPSPLGPPSSSPLQNSNQSPMMSPSASPLTQHSSPMHSPSPMISPSPGPVGNIMQSPSGSNMSPRIGTPHSQGDGSPVPSPSQVCLPPPPTPRMTSPQHKRIVTSPVGYSGDMRAGTPQMRFVRTTGGEQRVARLPSPLMGFQQKPGTPSPLSSPPPQQMNMSQQLIQKQLQQHSLEQDGNLMNSQRAAQLIQQRNFARQQMTIQGVAQPHPLTAQQHQMMVQQQQQLAKQQQQQIAQMQAQLQAQQRMQQQQQQQPQVSQPTSPMPPKSPLISQQIMSPHSMPASPMPPRSPMMSFGNTSQTPNSPVSRTTPNYHQNLNQQPPTSPMTHNQYQPPSSPMPRSPMVQMHSPMSIRRPPSASSSPAMSDRPTIDNMIDQNGGGNPNNNPIPAPPCFGRYGYVKLGLRGGSPMWGGFGRGAKRIPTPPIVDKNIPIETSLTVKPKKESHLSKVSILKRKSPAKTNLQSLAVSKVGSLVSTDYNEFDDSSSTPPVTPPPIPSTSRIPPVQKTIVKKPEIKENNPVLVVHSPDEEKLRCHDIMDYDDDNNTVISGEVSLSSTAQQNDGDDIAVIETFSQSDLGEALPSPLESEQMADDEYLLFPGNMVVDISGEPQYSDKDEEAEEDCENMHVMIRSPTTSDDEFIMQNKQTSIRRIQSNHLDAPYSPEQEDMQVDPSPEPVDEDNYEESEIVIIDHSIKSPEEQISTKEDFEELIDEGSKKDKVKEEVTAKHIQEIHKYTANVYSFPQKIEHSTPATVANRVTNLKLGQKISLITTPVVHSITTVTRSDSNTETQNAKLGNTTTTSKVTNIILSRANVLGVPKLVTTGSPAAIPIASILPSGFTVPVISASAVRQLPNVKVIDKPSSSISLTTHDSFLPKKIFEDDSVSPDSSNCEDEKSKDSSDEKVKSPSLKKEVVIPLTIKNFTQEKPVQNKNISPSIQAIQKIPLDLVKVSDQKPKEEIKVVDQNKIETITSKVNDIQRTPSPAVTTSSSPVILHSTPELKMTAQVIQESQSGMQITAHTETVDGFDGGSGDDTKSVVISIPSPTPSQEQMLDNIALQALENRRRDGNGIPSEFESFEDVLDMIENITGEPPTVLDNIKEKLGDEGCNEKKYKPPENDAKQIIDKEKEIHPAVSMAMTTKPSVVPQLSPLSQPADLTTNMANASQQLRTLLSSSYSTNTSTSLQNVETVVHGNNNQVTTAPVLTSSPVVTTRIAQQSAPSTNTVIVPNMKQTSIVTAVVTPIRSQVTTVANSTVSSPSPNIQVTNSNFLTRNTENSMNTVTDQVKSPKITTTHGAVITTMTTSFSMQKSTTSASTECNETSRKPTYSLTEMLQSHPAAVPTTKTSVDTITAASLLSTSIGLSRAGFSTSLVQAQPHVVVSPVTSTAPSNLVTSSPVATSQSFKPVTSTTNLLHTQLTKVVRSKSLEDPCEIPKPENKVTENDALPSVADVLKPEFSSCKFSLIQSNSNRTEDSQNVLLKKLLQNTACASTQTQVPSSTVAPMTVAAPIQYSPTIAENQLKPSTPTLSSILPPVTKDPPTTSPQNKPQVQRASSVPSFVTSPVVQQPITTTPTQQLHIDVKKCLPPSRTPSRDDLLSPPTPRSSCSQDSSLQTPPLVIKKEVGLPFQPQNIILPQDVKKEFVDETSQHSEVSDHSRPDVQMKEEIDSMEMNEKLLMEQKEVLKKQKRRMYQQKRRQNMTMNKEAIGQPKKRPRKSSKVEEDYDTYIEGVLQQLRTLPPLIVSEPVLNRNFSILPVFGSDLSKLATGDYDSRFGELTGEYGYGILSGYSDFYNSQPYGDEQPLPEKPPASTQRGFYDQEFPLIKFDNDEDKRFDLFCREDSPDSIISSSSPECPFTEPHHKFLGLKLIDDDDDDDEEEDIAKMRMSPVVPIIAPIPIRLKPVGQFLKDYTDVSYDFVKFEL